MMKALELTSKSWILSIRQGNVGIMRKDDDKYIIIGSDHSGSYNSLKDVEDTFNEEILFDTLCDDKEKALVDNYPTKHSEVFDIIIEDIPSYTKRQGSTDRYAAGYYAIKFEKGCQSSFCPRLSTLENQKIWQGPFKTKIEVDHAVKLLSEK